MAVINLVVPRLQRRVFTGGILCIFEYAKGLTARGHQVNILPSLPSPPPEWIQGDYGELLGTRPPREKGGVTPPPSARANVASLVRDLATRAGIRAARLFPPEVQRGFVLHHIQKLMRTADVTVATSFETALPVFLYGTGRLFYFMQHFEPYFAVDMPNAAWSEYEARASYRLGLNMIANSSWLKQRVFEETGTLPAVCANAIDHAVFDGEPKRGSPNGEVRIISYGGRRATWKGFRDMAVAMRAVREALPQRRIRWLVYGESLLPPNNDIAPYEHLGFLKPHALARAYREADILLSASWYESFPLFPIEAMACGLAVVTTRAGTEEFATHEQTAEIVEPRDPENIARGLARVVTDVDYRFMLAANARKKAREFTWDRSVARFESLLLSSEQA